EQFLLLDTKAKFYFNDTGVRGFIVPKGDLEMEAKFKWVGKIAASLGLLGFMFAASGSAMADTYNIFLKSGGAVQSCATGGFTFTKTIAGTFNATSPSVTLNGTPSTPCFGVIATRTLNTGTLSVTVADVILNGQDQGLNVVSINGSLSNGNANGSYTIHFNTDKSFTVTQKQAPNNPQVGSGGYDFRNVNSVPEPETLWLSLGGLGALALSRRKRHRS
ncbi:MAG: PEP-CTERM sorting domain-containing protein, partial [Thiobacillaceae bacterium]